MDQLTSQDTLKYEKLKRDATSSVLAFRTAVRTSAELYSRPQRRLISQVSTRDTPSYLLLTEWSEKVAPEVEDLLKAREAKPLSNALSKYLLISKLAATDAARHLVERRIFNVNETFLSHCYGGGGRARAAARGLLNLPIDEVYTIRDNYIEYQLHQLVARECGITVCDPHAPIVKKTFQKLAERSQINHYKKLQEERLTAIDSRLEEIRSFHYAIIARILAIELDSSEVLDAYQQYKKRLETLKPASRTAEKRLALFETATKKIRKDLTDKQSKTEKISDLQNALQTIDDVLVELFDMSEAEHDILLAYLREYKKLERESTRIKKELTGFKQSDK